MCSISAQSGQGGGGRNNAGTTRGAPRGRAHGRGNRGTKNPNQRALSEGSDRARCEDGPGRWGKRGRGIDKTRGKSSGRGGE